MSERVETNFFGFDVIDIGARTSIPAASTWSRNVTLLFLLTPVPIEPFNSDLLCQVGNGHRHREFSAEFGG